MLKLGEEQDIVHKGTAVRLGKLTLAVLEPFFDWIRGEVGDPWAVAERFVDRLQAPQALQLVKEAQAADQALRGLDITSDLFAAWMSKARGQARLIHLLSGGRMSEADAFDYVAEQGRLKAQEVLEKAAGEGDAGNAGGAAAAAGRPTGDGRSS